MTGRVEGKVALVTGAARGQGRAHALRLAEEGADIVAVDVCAELGVPYPSSTPEELAETVALVKKLGRRIVSAQVDIRDIGALRTAVDDAVAELGRLDVVVANAGICVPAMWDRVTPELFEHHQSTNVTGTWNTVMVGAPHLVRAGGGSVILISSAAGLTVQPFLVPYTTSKFAVRGMAKAFAVELGEHGIRVNSVHPCAVRTPMGGGDVLGSSARRSRRIRTWPGCSPTCCPSTRPSRATSRTPCCSSPPTSRGSSPRTSSPRTRGSRSTDP